MKCHVCGAAMQAIATDLPFKVGQHAIVIIKELPVIQCTGCQEFLIEDRVMKAVEAILKRAGNAAELEVVRYAA